MDLIDKAAVLKILKELYDQADEVEAAAGTTPTAQEALDWAESAVLLLPAFTSGLSDAPQPPQSVN